jgi:DNA-binding MarR family transcriptional regulator
VLKSLRVVSRHMAQMAHGMAARMGIHPTDLFAIMDIVDFRERHGRSPTIGELGEVAALSSAAATTLVDRLVSAGYVERIRDTQDRRRVHLQLTPRHLEAAAPMLRVYLERLSAALDSFGDDELDAAARVLEASRVAMEQSADSGSRPHAGARDAMAGAANSTVVDPPAPATGS